MYSIELQWKDGYNVDLEYFSSWISSNAGTYYDGLSAGLILDVIFTQDPGSTDESAVINYWNDIGKDDTKTVTGTGTSMTMSANPTYTVKVGDKITVGSETRNINTVTDQSNYIIDSAFTSDPTAAACVVCSPGVDSYIDDQAIASEVETVKSGLVAKIDAGTDDWSTMTKAEKKIAIGVLPSRDDLGI